MRRIASGRSKLKPAGGRQTGVAADMDDFGVFGVFITLPLQAHAGQSYPTIMSVMALSVNLSLNPPNSPAPSFVPVAISASLSLNVV